MSPKTKPNEKCHCGSMKKYKKCCQISDQKKPTTSNTREAKTTEQLIEINEDFGLWGYPKSNYFDVGRALLAPDNLDEAMEAFKRGAEEKGCVGCMVLYIDILVVYKDTISLAIPWLLEAAIRGHDGSIQQLMDYHDEESELTQTPTISLSSFWAKVKADKNEEDRKACKKHNTQLCVICRKGELNSVGITLEKCGICKYYSYCGTNCQTRHWKEGKHMNECRQLKILRKFCKPRYVQDIRKAITSRADPKEIQTLQTIRTELGLNRPKQEYEELLLLVDNGGEVIYPFLDEYGVARKDGTVHIGSTPNVI